MDLYVRGFYDIFICLSRGGRFDKIQVNNMQIFLISAIICFIVALAVRKLALHHKVLDTPDNERKQHAGPVPLWGGLAIFIAFWCVVAWLVFVINIEHKHLSGLNLVGMFAGSLLLLIIGLADDKYKLSPKLRLLATALAAVAVIAGGTEFSGITNPFGGMIPLDQIKIGNFLLLANIIIFFWIMGMTYAVKIIDGLDGLAVGIVLIGALMIYFLTYKGIYYQADVSAVSLALAGVCLGFLILNFYPAKIYLGEAGGLILGFILGALAIVAGGKIATALLVMAIPVLDLIRVIYLRIKIKQPVFQGDRRHLHFQLLDLGLKHWQAVMVLYAFAFLFGISTLFLQSKHKLFVLAVLAIAMLIFGIWLGSREERDK